MIQEAAPASIDEMLEAKPQPQNNEALTELLETVEASIPGGLDLTVEASIPGGLDFQIDEAVTSTPANDLLSSDLVMGGVVAKVEEAAPAKPQTVIEKDSDLNSLVDFKEMKEKK